MLPEMVDVIEEPLSQIYNKMTDSKHEHSSWYHAIQTHQ